MTRRDVTPAMVADLWFARESQASIAARLEIAPSTVQVRLETARAEYPHLPWSERRARRRVRSWAKGR